MPLRPHCLAATTLALAFALPAVASAGTLTVDRPCYTHFVGTSKSIITQPILVTVTGGTPGGEFQVRAGKATADGGSGSATGTFDPSGNATTTLTDVFPPSGSINPLAGDVIHLAVHDFASDADIATATTSITNAAVQVGDKPTNPYRKRVLRVSGLTPVVGAGALYGSYVSGTNGKKVVKRVKLGTPNACGYLRVKRVLPPRRGVHRWTLFIHVGPKLDRGLSLIYHFRVFRRFI